MATSSIQRLTKHIHTTLIPRPALRRPQTWRRSFKTQVTTPRFPEFAFSFDIDGVLMRGGEPIPGAHEALSYLQTHRIPFILLTNGGGKSEPERVADLSSKLDLPLNTDMFIQSHTPFGSLAPQYADKTVLIVGGDQDECQLVALNDYGFHSVVTPGDILCAEPDIWPFSHIFLDYYKAFAKPLPLPINPVEDPASSLKIDAIFVYNDPRDWGLDSTIMLDLLLSQQGILGTLSAKNGSPALPNRGYLQDGQPKLYYSNPDLWWAARYPLPRLGQGGFRSAFDGLWAAVTGGAHLEKTIIGKPFQRTFEFAEERLRAHRKAMFGLVGLHEPLKRVYMVGDNPESDIRGANEYRSPHGSRWTSVLVKTGVHREGVEPSCRPSVVVEDVEEAVRWAVEDARKG